MPASWYRQRGRVKGKRGRVQVRRRPTISALSGPVSVRRMDHHAFLAPPHRTGRAVCPHPALGRVSHPSMRRRLKREAPEPEYPQLPKDDVSGIALRPSRRDLVSPPQKVPRTFPDVVIDRPVGHEPCAVGEVVRPPAQYAIELVLHLAPRRLVARAEDLSDASLDPLDRLLGWRGPHVLMTILPVPHRPVGVAQKGKRLAPPVAHPGFLLVERQPHLGEPPTALREHLRRPITTQDHEVVRVVDKPRPVTSVEPMETKDFQVPIHIDVREQRRNHPALGRPARGPLAATEPPPAP